MDESEEALEKEHWCFVSYQYKVEDDPIPRFGNITFPMRGHITDGAGFEVLKDSVNTAVKEDVKKVSGKQLKGVPVILYFKELGYES